MPGSSIVLRCSQNHRDGFKKGRETWDGGPQPEFSHRLILTSNPPPQPPHQLWDGGREGRELQWWEDAQKPLTWGRTRAPPGSGGGKAASLSAIFPSSLRSSPAGAPSVPPGCRSRGIPAPSQGCAQLAMTPALCQMTPSSAAASLICPFPGLWYCVPRPRL